jgi:hypothetical protein
MFNYQKPFIKTLSDKSFSFNAFAASVILVFNDCDGPFEDIGTLEVENNQLAFCLPPGLEPSDGQVINVQCDETGSEVFVVTLESVSCDGNACDSPINGGGGGDSLCDITVNISSAPPSVCTVSAFESGGTDACDLNGALQTDTISAP